MQALPPLIFQHFRDPQNQGELDPADAVGVIEGRVEESWIRFYLRDGPDGITTSYVFEGDRSPVAALSLFTQLINGKPLEEAEQHTVESLCAALDLEERFHPMFLPAVDALKAAAAKLRGEPDPFGGDGQLICHCLNVRQGYLERIIGERKLKTIEDVRHWTRACTGCRSCRADVDEILDRLG